MIVFLTGGSGFVGLNLAEQLLSRGDSVVSLSLMPPSDRAMRNFAQLPGDFHHINADVCDVNAVENALAQSGARHLIHGAVITAGRDREIRDPTSIVSTNVQGTVSVLEAARRHGIERFVYLSSASVYGANAQSGEVLSEEDTAPLPQTLYAVTKYAAEGVARRYGAIFKMPMVSARLSAVFGRWEHDTGLRDTLSPPYWLVRMAAGGESAVLADEGFRDWIYGPDVANGVIALLDSVNLRHDVYNIGTGYTWSLWQWCEKLAGRYGEFSFRLGDPPDADGKLDAGRRSPLSVDRILSDTAYRPRFGLDESFRDYLEWLQD